jgi:CheY-like chemotaxis protein
MLPQAESRGILVEMSLPDQPIVSAVDPMRIQQVISNLLGNSVKFTPEGGRASVVLNRDGGGNGIATSLVIQVTDTGIGIEPDFLPFVFDRFTQAHEGMDRQFGGLGLGLAITRAIVELHGGQVTAHSDGPGRGSCFTVKLPIAVSRTFEEGEGLSESASDESGVQDLGLRVLIIEDSLDTLNMLKLWLGSFGCEVWVAAEAMEGMRIATDHPPDLIISDIGMPDVDGYELMRVVRKTPGLENVPAIALTGYAREEDRELALEAGYDAHISKPANMSRLLYLIKTLTRDKQS